MDDTVMIPCRLRDIPVDTVVIPNVREENNNKAVLPTVNLNGDLYQFYVMLHAIKSEIIAGSNKTTEESFTDDQVNESDPVNDAARKQQHLSDIIYEVCSELCIR
uniref:Uncharacterized protein n=1 Tax=Arion vulgaris TaxID=1028688 RepID=A0A0B7AS55_9EUPU